MKTHVGSRGRVLVVLALLLSLFGLAGTALAQLPPAGAASQFTINGFLQAATVTAPTPLAGGTLTINGQLVVVPANTIVVLPANQLTWQELFSQAPAPYGPTQTGMAFTDVPAPLTPYEVSVVGNKVGNSYIAGLISIAQQALNSGQGYINFIDYGLGELRVGGTLNDPNCKATGVAPAGGLLCTGARVRINDPTGKFSKQQTPDPRFTLDPDNPTITSGTGFPMCLPRTDPAGLTPDLLCPQTNRPKDATGAFLGIVNLPDPALVVAGGPDPRVQAPFEIGDFVTYSGTLVSDNVAQPTVGPYTPTLTTYISAHTMENNAAIYTAAGTDPAYVKIDVSLMGTGGITTPGAAEAAFRTRFEGMMTDPTRQVHLYGLDFAPGTGLPTPRDWGTIGVDQGAPNGAVKGRWRFRPPCSLAPGATPTDKACTPPPAGVFDPAPREVLAVIETPAHVKAAQFSVANGIIPGQYHAPIGEYIFPEQVPGSAPPPMNFDAVPFLAQGGYPSTMGTLAGQLSPWPGATLPSLTPPTVPPTPANAPGDVIIASVVYRIAKQRLQVTATSAVAATLFLQAFDAAGNAMPYTTAPIQMVPVLGVPTIDVVGAPMPAKVVVTSTAGGFESTDLTQLPFGQPTAANIGKYTVTPDQPAAPLIPVTIRSN